MLYPHAFVIASARAMFHAYCTRLCFVLSVALLLLAGAPDAFAQWAVGGSYQVQVGVPVQGGRIQLERSFRGPGASTAFVRANAAYFPQQTEQFLALDYGWTVRARAYDVALGGGFAGRSGRFRAYAGLSGGYERRTGEEEEGGFNWGPEYTPIDAGSFYAAPFAGGGVRVLGFVRPFAEYGYSFYLGERIRSNNIGRLSIGVRFGF